MRRRLLLVVRQPGLLDYYDQALGALAEDGVDVVVRSAGMPAGDAVAAPSSPVAAFGELPVPGGHASTRLSLRLQKLADVLRYAHPDYAQVPQLRERVLAGSGPDAPPWTRRLARHPREAAVAIRVIRVLDDMLPPGRVTEQLLDAERPDAVVVSPGVLSARVQGEIVKAARRRGVPTAVWVPSWDNLTNKGLLPSVPDRVFVWNDHQRRELERYHGVPADRVVVTGAQTFDRWPSDVTPAPREAFLAGLGLDPRRAFVLYVGSSWNIAPDEAEFVQGWLDALRAHDDPAVAEASVLVRPHPTPRSLRGWYAHGLPQGANVGLSLPRTDAPPGSAAFGDEYRNALAHADVVVGINTSAMLEAALFGAPVCTVERTGEHDPFARAMHYRYLADDEYGLLYRARSFDEHLAQLGALLAAAKHPDPRSQRFVRTFLRPAGDGPASPRFVAAVHELLALPSRPARRHRVGGAVLSAIAPVLLAPFEEHPVQWLVTAGRLGARVQGYRLLVVARRALRAASGRGRTIEHDALELEGVRDTVVDPPRAGGDEIADGMQPGRDADRT